MNKFFCLILILIGLSGCGQSGEDMFAGALGESANNDNRLFASELQECSSELACANSAQSCVALDLSEGGDDASAYCVEPATACAHLGCGMENCLVAESFPLQVSCTP